MPTLPELLDQTALILARWTTYLDEIRLWSNGTETGGPGSDGYYPVTDGAGDVSLLPSPRKMRQLSASVEVENLAGAGPFAVAVGQIAKRIAIANGASTATIPVTIPDEAVGSVWFFRQAGAAPLKFVGASGVTIVNRRGHNGTAGQYAGVSVTIEAAGIACLDGDTAVVA